MKEIEFIITSFLENGYDLLKRWWVFDDEVLEESDTKDIDTVFTQKVIMNLEQ